jgi:hypothetical protein
MAAILDRMDPLPAKVEREALMASQAKALGLLARVEKDLDLLAKEMATATTLPMITTAPLAPPPRALRVEAVMASQARALTTLRARAVKDQDLLAEEMATAMTLLMTTMALLAPPPRAQRVEAATASQARALTLRARAAKDPDLQAEEMATEVTQITMAAALLPRANHPKEVLMLESLASLQAHQVKAAKIAPVQLMDTALLPRDIVLQHQVTSGPLTRTF